MVSKSELFAVLEKISIFGAIPANALENICDRAQRMTCGRGELLFREGEPSTAIYIIIRGRIKLVKSYENDPLEIVELGPGSSLGEASYIGIQAHSATALVTDDVTLMVLSKSVFSKLYAEDPQLFTMLVLNIARELARRVHKYSDYLTQLKR
ncbi:MAG: cyclic nucleotide-binding domain-containing protein [Fibrobacterota bacterium]